MTFSSLRFISIFFLFIASYFFLKMFGDPGFLNNSNSIETGFILFCVILTLVSLNIRKKFPYLPIGKVSTWLRIHIYLAWFSFIIFFSHIGFKIPTGPFEKFLALLFLAAAGSGIVGAFLTILVPKLLTGNGGAYVFDAIPLRVRELQEEAKELAFSTVQKSGQKTLSGFFNFRLADYFQIQRFSWNVVFNSEYDRVNILRECDSLERYLSENEIKLLDQWREMVIEKSRLDYHYSLLLIMKFWLFFHVPVSYGLTIIGGFHGLLAYTFTGN
jgi:hypothetical protein